ncbi:MAG TPA: pentapeptide repeat-containing protein, partial [Allosphingosinicella sp.]|nr:pentapeptide repeat-containing protein [Allosphingosinicella sp.]
RADLRGARLDRICFLGTKLAGAQLRGANLSGSAFVDSDLSGADLRETRMRRILLRNSVLKNVDAQRSILAGGRFDGGWFEGSVEGFRLDSSDLTGFRFDCGITLDDGCPIDGGRLTLRGAILRDSNLFTYADVTGARIDRTRVSPTELPDLRAAVLEGPVIVTGGEQAIELSVEEYRSLLPHFREPAESQPLTAEGGERLKDAPPGAHLYFVDHPETFTDSFRSHPLYRRLLPALIDASWSQVAVKVNADGSIDASGEAVGANAHSCSLDAAGLRFDPATGWYSGAQEGGTEVPAQWRGKPMPVLRFRGQQVDVWRMGKGGDEEGDPRESDFASCGARAAFSPMLRVPLSTAQVERLLEKRGPAGAP